MANGTVSTNAADKNYDAQAFLEATETQGTTPVIPPRKNRNQPHDYDAHLNKERHLVECFINTIKHYRRIFSHFETLDVRYLGFLSFISTLIWLR
jgi:transposase